MRRLVWTLGLTVSVSASGAGGQTPAQPAGVLVGLRNAEGTGFRTLWLAPGIDGSFALAGEIPHLVVPRRTGFWRVGVVEACSQKEFELLEPGWSLDRIQHLFAVPIDREPVVAVDSGRRPAGTCRREPVVCENERSALVEFVWPDFVSLDHGARSECGMHPDADFRYAILRLDDLDARGLAVGEALGPGGADAFRHAYRKSQQDHLAAWKDNSFGSCEVFDPDERNWHVDHSAGRWRIRGWGDTHRLCGFGFDFSVEAALPSFMVGDNGGDRGVPDRLRQREPQLVDLFFSPRSESALGVTERALLVFRSPSSADPDVPVRLDLLSDEAVVLVEWATGSAVDRWSREIALILRNGLPPPRIAASRPTPQH